MKNEAGWISCAIEAPGEIFPDMPDERMFLVLCTRATNGNKSFVVTYTQVLGRKPSHGNNHSNRESAILIRFAPHPAFTIMSDSDGDFSDELLELAGAGDAPEKKRKKRQGSSGKSSKRRKPE